MIGFIFCVVISGALNAFMDKVENRIQYNSSVFRNWNAAFWCKEVSAHYVKFLPLTRYRPDAWHQAKSLMLLFLAFGMVFLWTAPMASTPIFMIIEVVGLFGISWLTGFNIAYKLFQKKMYI
jgi:ABC-type antimicrobial peptide transport system permease subunit